MKTEIFEFEDYKKAMYAWDNGIQVYHDHNCDIEFSEGDSFSTDGRKFYYKLNEFPMVVNEDYSDIEYCDWQYKDGDRPSGYRLMIVREVFERK